MKLNLRILPLLAGAALAAALLLPSCSTDESDSSGSLGESQIISDATIVTDWESWVDEVETKTPGSQIYVLGPVVVPAEGTLTIPNGAEVTVTNLQALIDDFGGAANVVPASKATGGSVKVSKGGSLVGGALSKLYLASGSTLTAEVDASDATTGAAVILNGVDVTLADGSTVGNLYTAGKLAKADSLDIVVTSKGLRTNNKIYDLTTSSLWALQPPAALDTKPTKDGTGYNVAKLFDAVYTASIDPANKITLDTLKAAVERYVKADLLNTVRAYQDYVPSEDSMNGYAGLTVGAGYTITTDSGITMEATQNFVYLDLLKSPYLALSGVNEYRSAYNTQAAIKYGYIGKQLTYTWLPRYKPVANDLDIGIAYQESEYAASFDGAKKELQSVVTEVNNAFSDIAAGKGSLADWKSISYSGAVIGTEEAATSVRQVVNDVREANSWKVDKIRVDYFGKDDGAYSAKGPANPESVSDGGYFLPWITTGPQILDDRVYESATLVSGQDWHFVTDAAQEEGTSASTYKVTGKLRFDRPVANAKATLEALAASVYLLRDADLTDITDASYASITKIPAASATVDGSTITFVFDNVPQAVNAQFPTTVWVPPATVKDNWSGLGYENDGPAGSAIVAGVSYATVEYAALSSEVSLAGLRLVGADAANATAPVVTTTPSVLWSTVEDNASPAQFTAATIPIVGYTVSNVATITGLNGVVDTSDTPRAAWFYAQYSAIVQNPDYTDGLTALGSAYVPSIVFYTVSVDTQGIYTLPASNAKLTSAIPAAAIPGGAAPVYLGTGTFGVVYDIRDEGRKGPEVAVNAAEVSVPESFAAIPYKVYLKTVNNVTSSTGGEEYSGVQVVDIPKAANAAKDYVVPSLSWEGDDSFVSTDGGCYGTLTASTDITASPGSHNLSIYETETYNRHRGQYKQVTVTIPEYKE